MSHTRFIELLEGFDKKEGEHFTIFDYYTGGAGRQFTLIIRRSSEAIIRSGDAIDSFSLRRTLRFVEEDLIRRVFERTGGNRTKTAELLEISCRQLLYKLKEYGID